MMFSQVIKKSARAVQVPQIRVKAERSGLWAVSEDWSAKMGCLGVPQRRQDRHSSERRYQR